MSSPTSQLPPSTESTAPAGLYPSKEALELAFKAIRKAVVPQIPDVLLALRKELNRPEPDLKIAADLIAQDLAISGQVLKTVNSPLFGARTKVSSVHQAVAMMGIRRVAALASADAIERALRHSQGGAARVVWESIMEQARAAVAVARRTGCIDPEEAYLFGLMHDVGSLIFADQLEDYATVWILHAATPSALLEHERKALGVDHTTVGFLLAGTWQLPGYTTLAIYHHHDPLAVKLADARVRTLIAVAKLAYYLRALAQSNQDAPEMLAYLDDARQELEFNDEVLAALSDEAMQGCWTQDDAH
ncbi:HDOD domain-containing protein [Marichromatium bheemlicum]|uniref:HDOD domain-containing protein n=1 Tax=Marichromatium bheemlicum TaxID=365339 RepID=A0ABX1IAQ0_9GAMM|nr:HDOD domain-containing protein [Marichromatium bheemlicum]NKN34124.1 HDOD domain-containing protein [Marichromatium bheemlicum]